MQKQTTSQIKSLKLISYSTISSGVNNNLFRITFSQNYQEKISSNKPIPLITRIVLFVRINISSHHLNKIHFFKLYQYFIINQHTYQCVMIESIDIASFFLFFLLFTVAVHSANAILLFTSPLNRKPKN